ncbi:MAG: molybdenum cofactor guanylyltransferase [Nitrospiraceae bacterium]|nr:molybdenum cofactor guanylyltransferase [Nitrospiraceae bacterium]
MFAAVLAGGENTRYPITKGFIEIEGRRLIDSAVSALGGLPFFSGRVVVSTNEPEKYFYLRVPLIGDVYAARGPMTGIFSVLRATGASWVFVAACDMPFINMGLVLKMASMLDKKGSFDVLSPLWRGWPEPLLSFYSSRCLGEMEKRILAGKTGLQEFLNDVPVSYLAEADVRRIDPEGASFVNINTEGDFRNAVALLKQGKPGPTEAGICSD